MGATPYPWPLPMAGGLLPQHTLGCTVLAVLTMPRPGADCSKVDGTNGPHAPIIKGLGCANVAHLVKGPVQCNPSLLGRGGQIPRVGLNPKNRDF